MRRTKSILDLVRRPATPRSDTRGIRHASIPTSLGTLDSPSETAAVFLFDHALFPSILQTILSYASRETLIAIRTTCKALKHDADEKLARHTRFVLGDKKEICVEAQNGRLPCFSPWSDNPLLSQGSGTRPPPPVPFQCIALSVFSVSGRRRRRPQLLLPPPPPALGPFSSTSIIDIGTPDPPSFVAAVLDRAPVQMIRLTPAVKLPYYHRPQAKMDGLTIVHFWMEKACLLPTFPPAIQERVTKVVFTVRHYCPVPERLRWCEAYNSRYPNVQTVVFIFGSNSVNGPQWITDPSYFHKEHARKGEEKARPCMFTSFVCQVARILVCTRNATVTLVALRDVPHPRFLGVIIPDPLDGTLGDQLEAHFLDQIEKEVVRTAPNFGVVTEKHTLEAYMDRVQTVSIEAYRDQTGSESFDLEVHA